MLRARNTRSNDRRKPRADTSIAQKLRQATRAHPHALKRQLQALTGIQQQQRQKTIREQLQCENARNSAARLTALEPLSHPLGQNITKKKINVFNE